MRLHFIAIGGSAMHNLAIALKIKGYDITGSDDEIFEPSLSRLLKYNILPEKSGWFPEKIHTGLDAIVLGMHARADNPELLRAQVLGLKIFSYPEFLYEQSKFKKRVVIGGSHGKTTITSMILHVLQTNNIDVDYMVGAQLEGFEVMVRLSESAQWMVLEGDEYLTSPIDRVPKFLHYHPHIAVISGIGWDHINVFPTFDNYVDQFRSFIRSIEPGGLLIYDYEDEEVRKISKEITIRSIGYEMHPYKASGLKSFVRNSIGDLIELQIFGRHNMMNLNAARFVCLEMGISDDDFYNAMASFKGASRRLELLFSGKSGSIFRDFAHAPSKVKASVLAVRQQFPELQLIACLELHTFSSLNEGFIDQYKNSIDPADIAIVFYDPHAVALKRLPEISFDRIRKAFGKEGITVFSEKKLLLDYLLGQDWRNTTAIFMSSGNFDGINFDQFIMDIGWK
jgi:UDP-N-acetylmuramate: L-alanyl-gamma-D-glutamyl-meso-diaminopimelate ligase